MRMMELLLLISQWYVRHSILLTLNSLSPAKAAKLTNSINADMIIAAGYLKLLM